MFSSFFQYLCLAPSFTNVLNVYAFCNLHDVRRLEFDLLFTEELMRFGVLGLVGYEG